MTNIDLFLIGPPGAVNTALSSVVSSITGSGVTLSDEVTGTADVAFSDETTLAGLTITLFHARILFPLTGTRAQFDALKTSLAAVKTANPTISFTASYLESATL